LTEFKGENMPESTSAPETKKTPVSEDKKTKAVATPKEAVSQPTVNIDVYCKIRKITGFNATLIKKVMNLKYQNARFAAKTWDDEVAAFKSAQLSK